MPEGVGASAGALAKLDEALLYEGNYSLARVERAVLRMQLGDFDGAEADASEALCLLPNYPFAFLLRGAAQRAGDKAGAAEDFRHALEIAPADWEFRQQTMQRLSEITPQPSRESARLTVRPRACREISLSARPENNASHSFSRTPPKIAVLRNGVRWTTSPANIDLPPTKSLERIDRRPKNDVADAGPLDRPLAHRARLGRGVQHKRCPIDFRPLAARRLMTSISP